MVALRNIILFISAVTAVAISKRTATTILGDIMAIGTNVKPLTTAANNYNGQLGALITLNTAVATLGTSIKAAADDAAATTSLSSLESNEILTSITNVTPDIETALSAIANKASTFASFGLTSTVAGNLTSLKKDTDTFGKNLNTICSSDVVSKLTAAQATIDISFTSAQSHF